MPQVRPCCLGTGDPYFREFARALIIDRKSFLPLALLIPLTAEASSDFVARLILLLPLSVIVFLIVAWFITKLIKPYWVRTGIRLFVVCVIFLPLHCSGFGLDWLPNVMFLFCRKINYFYLIINPVLVTVFFLITWWIIKNKSRYYSVAYFITVAAASLGVVYGIERYSDQKIEKIHELVSGELMNEAVRMLSAKEFKPEGRTGVEDPWRRRLDVRRSPQLRKNLSGYWGKIEVYSDGPNYRTKGDDISEETLTNTLIRSRDGDWLVAEPARPQLISLMGEMAFQKRFVNGETIKYSREQKKNLPVNDGRGNLLRYFYVKEKGIEQVVIYAPGEDGIFDNADDIIVNLETQSKTSDSYKKKEETESILQRIAVYVRAKENIESGNKAPKIKDAFGNTINWFFLNHGKYEPIEKYAKFVGHSAGEDGEFKTYDDILVVHKIRKGKGEIRFVGSEFFEGFSRFKSKHYDFSVHCKSALIQTDRDSVVSDVIDSLQNPESEEEVKKVIKCAALLNDDKEIINLIYAIAKTPYRDIAAWNIIEAFDKSKVKSQQGIDAILTLKHQFDRNSRHYQKLIRMFSEAGDAGIKELVELTKDENNIIGKEALWQLLRHNINHEMTVDAIRYHINRGNFLTTIIDVLDESDEVNDRTIEMLAPEIRKLDRNGNFKAFELLRRHAVYPIPKGYIIVGRHDSSDERRVGIFDKPGGEIVGEVVFYPMTGGLRDGNDGPQITAVFKGESISIGSTETEASGELYNDNRYLLYYDVSQGYAQILSSRQERAAWIPIQSSSHELILRTWIESMVGRGGYFLYGYNNSALNKKPSSGSETILTLDEEKHYIQEFTGAISGAWAEAVVLEFDKKPNGCVDWSDYIKENGYKRLEKGWIKLVNDRGLKEKIDFYEGC